MDFGDDPLISALYAQENVFSAEALASKDLGMFDKLRTRRLWLSKPLQELRKDMVTPNMMIASGAKWPQLHKTYGVDSLLDFGFHWDHMMACGLQGAHLRHFTKEQLQRAGVNATRMLQTRPTISHIASLQLSPDELVNMGWRLDLLQAIGLNFRNMPLFGFPLNRWVTDFGVNNFAELGFSSYSECAQAGWRDNEIRVALQAKP